MVISAVKKTQFCVVISAVKKRQFWVVITTVVKKRQFWVVKSSRPEISRIPRQKRNFIFHFILPKIPLW